MTDRKHPSRLDIDYERAWRRHLWWRRYGHWIGLSVAVFAAVAGWGLVWHLLGT